MNELQRLLCSSILGQIIKGMTSEHVKESSGGQERTKEP
jgi:hypothetical protein